MRPQLKLTGQIKITDLSCETDHGSFIEVHNTRVESEENPLDLHWIAPN